MVDAADQPAERHFVHDVLDAVIGIFRGGNVIDRQEYPGHGLHDEQEQ